MPSSPAAPQRTWTSVGKHWTSADDRAHVEAEIDRLEWKEIGDAIDLPFLAGHAINAAIEQLRLPKVSHVAHDGYLRYPDPLQSAPLALYGIECHYPNGRARVYVLDRGTGLTPLASDFWPTQPEGPEPQGQAA